MKDKGRKLSQKNVRYIVKNIVHHDLDTDYIAKLYDVSQRRVQQLAKEYRETKETPVLKRRGRKPCAEDTPHIDPLIIRLHQKYGISASLIGQMLRNRYKISMDNNRINEILKERGMSMDEPNKRVRKKPWIRYERKHSLTAVHMDWCHNQVLDLWVCAVLDDASRFVLSMIETEHATAQASADLLDEAYNNHVHIKPIQSVIVDHGTQFYANKRDKNGEAEHKFESYCENKGIQLILCKYHHPQSNGKIERFFQTYKKHRHRFATLDEFVSWYNTIRPHMSLDFDNFETPEKAFYRKAQDIILGNFFTLTENEMGVT